MLHQEVGVDYWKMLKAMLTYAALSLAGFVMLRLFSNILMMPRRLREQQQRVQNSLEELQKRYPDLRFSEEELKETEKEIEAEIAKMDKEKQCTKEDGTKKEAEGIEPTNENKKSK